MRRALAPVALAPDDRIYSLVHTYPTKSALPADAQSL